MLKESPDTSFGNSTLERPNGIGLVSRTALAVLLAVCCAKEVSAGKKSNSSDLITDTNSIVVSDKNNEKLQPKSIDINETINSTNIILQQVGSIKIIYNKLKTDQLLSEAEKKNFINAAQTSGLSDISKIVEILEKDQLTPEDNKLLLSQIRLIAIFQRDKILAQRNLIIVLYSRLQLDGSADPSVKSKSGKYLWTLNAVIQQMNKDYGLQ